MNKQILIICFVAACQTASGDVGGKTEGSNSPVPQQQTGSIASEKCPFCFPMGASSYCDACIQWCFIQYDIAVEDHRGIVGSIIYWLGLCLGGCTGDYGPCNPDSPFGHEVFLRREQ